MTELRIGENDLSQYIWNDTHVHDTTVHASIKSKAPAAVMNGFSRPYPATSTRAITQ